MVGLVVLVNVFESELNVKGFETHKKYIDVHFAIIGEETFMFTTIKLFV